MNPKVWNLWHVPDENWDENLYPGHAIKKHHDKKGQNLVPVSMDDFEKKEEELGLHQSFADLMFAEHGFCSLYVPKPRMEDKVWQSMNKNQ